MRTFARSIGKPRDTRGPPTSRPQMAADINTIYAATCKYFGQACKVGHSIRGSSLWRTNTQTTAEFFCSARLQFELPHAEDPVVQAEGTTDHDDENDEIVRVTASAGDFVSCDITTHKSVTERYFSFCGRRVTL